MDLQENGGEREEMIWTKCEGCGNGGMALWLEAVEIRCWTVWNSAESV